MKTLNIGTIVVFKYDLFPAKQNQAGVIINIEGNIYTVRFDWLERDKVTELKIHKIGMEKYFL